MSGQGVQIKEKKEKKKKKKQQQPAFRCLFFIKNGTVDHESLDSVT